MKLRIPISTYRLQFNRQFRFLDAVPLIEYLNQLGITGIYASPIFKSRENSLNGYDIIDPTQLNPELGKPEDFERLRQEIERFSMGLILDLVPNHLALDAANSFWMDFLENGQNSPYADFFDIDWGPCGESEDRYQIVLPVLAKPYAETIQNRELSLSISAGKLNVSYHDFRFPINLESYSLILAQIQTVLQKRLAENSSIHGEIKRLIKDIVSLDRSKGKEKNYLLRQGIKLRIERLFVHSPLMMDLLQASLAMFNSQTASLQSFNHLDELLKLQNYRLAFWKTGRDEINFRRFFDINNLIGIRVEVPRVFEITHSLVLSLVRKNIISGLRIDHIDGLYDPVGYLLNLRDHIADRKDGKGESVYIAVEKVLCGDERLPADWPVQGTTGYDFGQIVNGMFIDSAGIAEIDKSYAQLVRSRSNFGDIVYKKKKQVIDELFQAEINSLACRADNLTQRDRGGFDISKDCIKEILSEVTACLPVYRTYIRSFEISMTDKKNLEYALREAKIRKPALDEYALDFFKRHLLLDFGPDVSPKERKEWLHFVMRWQQVSGPVMAKGMEDTAFYSYNRLISLNEIGADLQLSAIPIEAFHKFNKFRLSNWPHSFNTTSTHDSKRSEDVRARINVLSEIPREWESHLTLWRILNEAKKQSVKGKKVPEPNIDSLLYQTLIGAWPLASEETSAFKDRFKSYILKAVREAKSSTDWINPNLGYENAVASFLDSVFDTPTKNKFLDDFIPFQKMIAFYGALNSLSQSLLKITSPGLPDFYQGTETWNFALADPDNRRQVDFSRNQDYLDAVLQWEEHDRPALIKNMEDKWEDGRIKLYTTYKALNARRDNSQLLNQGEYLPLEITGSRQRNIVAFARHYGREWVITVVPRFCVKLTNPGKLSLDAAPWRDDSVLIPESAPKEWTNVFTGGTLQATRSAPRLLMADILETFPVALLIHKPG